MNKFLDVLFAFEQSNGLLGLTLLLFFIIGAMFFIAR